MENRIVVMNTLELNAAARKADAFQRLSSLAERIEHLRRELAELADRLAAVERDIRTLEGKR